MPLEYNKLYQSLKKISAEWHAGHVEWFYTWNYLKFYEDGSVIEATLNSDNLKKINTNFTKEAPNISHGNFVYDGKEIKMTLNGSTFIGGFSSEKNVLFQDQKNLSWELYSIAEV